MDNFIPVLYEAIVNAYNDDDERVQAAIDYLASDEDAVLVCLQLCAMITALRFTQGNRYNRYESTSEGELTDSQAKVWSTTLALMNREQTLYTELANLDGVNLRELVSDCIAFASIQTGEL